MPHLRLRRLVASLVLGSTLPLVAVTPATAASCAVAWGSTPEAGTGPSVPTLTGVRAGRHACFDRLVVDLGGSVGSWRAAYVDVVRGVSGAVLPLRGGARLLVTFAGRPYDAVGRPTYRPSSWTDLAAVGSFSTLRQVAWAGAFEGESAVGVGVRARLPFRVFVLGRRLVVDVAHRW